MKYSSFCIGAFALILSACGHGSGHGVQRPNPRSPVQDEIFDVWIDGGVSVSNSRDEIYIGLCTECPDTELELRYRPCACDPWEFVGNFALPSHEPGSYFEFVEFGEWEVRGIAYDGNDVYTTPWRRFFVLDGVESFGLDLRLDDPTGFDLEPWDWTFPAGFPLEAHIGGYGSHYGGTFELFHEGHLVLWDDVRRNYWGAGYIPGSYLPPGEYEVRVALDMEFIGWVEHSIYFDVF